MADIWQKILTPVTTPTETLVNGTIDFYKPGTTGESNRKDVYTDSALSIIAANPYSLSANATAELFGLGLYHVVIKNSDGSTVYDWDNITLSIFSSAPATGSVPTWDGLASLGYATPEFFGAAGDGVTDDADAFADALNYCATNAPCRIVASGNYYLPAAKLQTGTGLFPTEGGLAFSSGVTLEMLDGASLVLEEGAEYPHILIPKSGADNILWENVVVDGGSGTYANGLVFSGIGGGTNDNIRAVNCRVKGLISELVVLPFASGALTQRQGGAAYVMELDGYGSMENCVATDGTFSLRYAPASSVRSAYHVKGLHSERMEAILNTTPSGFDNRDYAQDASYSKLMGSNLIMEGTTFKNCGLSTDARSQLSFIWRDSSAETGGRASGNYHPWAGIRRNTTGTYAGLNWEPDDFDSGDTEWNPASTYNDTDRVKFTNDGTLGGLFLFGRVGGVTINGVRGWNDHFAGGYDQIGAIFRGIMRGVKISDVEVDVSTNAIFHFGTTPSSTWDLQPFMISQYVLADSVVNLGATVKSVISDMPYNGTWATTFTTKVVDFEKAVQFVYLKDIGVRGLTTIVDASLSTDAPAEATTFDDATKLRFINITTGSVREGRFKDYASKLASTTDVGLFSIKEKGYFQKAGVDAVSQIPTAAGTFAQSILNNNSIFQWNGLNNVGASSSMYWDHTLQRLYTSRDNFFDLGTSSANWRRLYATEHIFPTLAAASALNNSLFVDSADGVLKFKDSGGVVNALY